jgi:hypothetical protein
METDKVDRKSHRFAQACDERLNEVFLYLTRNYSEHQHPATP